VRRLRHPPWLRKRLGPEGRSPRVRAAIEDLGLETVCASARCPNSRECFGRGTATFLILGPSCTRRCRFCAVEKGAPAPVDPTESARVAEAARRLGLAHVVVTSVTRDDLADGGAGRFVAVIRAIRAALPEATVEVLTPDFAEEVARVAAARPDVFNHNVETVPRLYASIRPGASFERSLEVLRLARAALGGEGIVKSGLMVGLGEREAEVEAVLGALADAGADAVTIGQYLAPTDAHAPVVEFVRPEVFERYAARARSLGFAAVASGPFVRSSYHAAEVLAAARTARRRIGNRQRVAGG